MPDSTNPAFCRRPAGTPTGGQFAGNTSLEPAGIVLEDEDDETYNSRGTYAFPPPPRSARQLILFWRNVEIPDHVLTKVWEADHYRDYELKVAEKNLNPREWPIEWGRPSPKKHHLRSYERDFARRGNRNLILVQQEHARLESQMPQSHIPHEYLRNVVIVARTFWQAQLLPESEREIVFRTEFPLSPTERFEPQVIMDFYQVHYIGEAF